MPKFLTNIDLSKNELQNARIQNLATAPSNPLPGQVYYHSQDKTFYGWNGTAWLDLGSTLTGDSIITLLNGSTLKINDDRLSANIADAIAKRHAHSNSAVLNAMEIAFTNALKTKIDGITAGANKVENSITNGNIKINGVEAVVYTHPTGTNPHGTTKADVGLGSVENKSSATIRGEITKANVTNGLGFTPIKDGGGVPEISGGLQASKPSATGSGLLYLETDTGKIWKDTAVGKWTQMGGQDLSIATKTTLGGIKVGANLIVAADGTLSAMGSDNMSTFIIKQEMFVATEGQKSFNLIKGNYQPNTNTISVYLYGGKQPNITFNEISSTSFEMIEPLKAGNVLIVEYIELSSATPYPIHGSDHLTGGYDPIPKVTNSQDGLMAKEDKGKLDGIATNANNYTHPTSHPATIITESTTKRFVSDAEKVTWNTVTDKSDKAYTDIELTKKVDKIAGKGLSAEDYTTAEKSKLLGVETGANKYTHPSTHDASIITESTTKRFVTDVEKAGWNAKETPAGAQAKADASLVSAKGYTDTKVANLVGTVPEALDTLQELADALGNDANFATTVMTEIGTKETPAGAQTKATTALNTAKAYTDTHSADAVKHILATERTKWNTVDNKVDKVTGKQLSTEDYTLAEKNKLSGVAAGAQVNTVTSVAGRTGAIALTKADVGLGNVDNIQQATKAEFNAHNTDTTKHITAVERTGWNAKTAKYSANIGNGTATEYLVSHGLATKDLAISVEEVATGEIVFTDIQKISTSQIKILFATAPSSNQFRVTVIG